MFGKFPAGRAWRRWGSMVALFAGLFSAAHAGENPLARETKPVRGKPGIRVAPGNWGTVDPRDVQVFLEAVAREVQSFAGEDSAAPLRIRVLPRGGSPRVLYERGLDGEYLVYLTARNEAWFQYAYQFSHELCHIFSRFDHKDREGEAVAGANQWFEESLCETASLYTLKRLATVWAEDPPARHWAGYGRVLADYADFLQRQAHRRLPAHQTLAQWYRDNRPAIEEDPYQREKNELVAAALLPLFEKDPGRWHAIAHLNPDTASAGKGFAEFLGDWHAACPPELQEVVRETMVLFGLEPGIGSVARGEADGAATRRQ